jgi:aminopeptidase N
MLTRLSSLGDKRVPDLIEKLEDIRLGDADEVRRRRFLVDCAWPDASAKEELFDRFLSDESLPERWVQNGASAFFQTGQSEMVAPYIRPAIEKLDWIKANRKIFFLADWINAVVGSITNREDARWVQSYVDRPTTQPDIAKKVLVALDQAISRLKVLESQTKD